MTHSAPALLLYAALSFSAVLAGCASTSKGVVAVVAIDDRTITDGVKTAISQSTELAAAEIDVATSDGIVQLIGYVGAADTVATAATVARSVKGVKSVQNDLRLK